MKSSLSLAFFTLATVAFIARLSASDKPTADEQAVMQMEKDWGVAVIKKDVATAERLQAPEFQFTTPDGHVGTRADGIAEVKGSDYVVTSYEISDLKVKVYGDAAVAFGVETEKSTYKGKDTSGQSRFTDTFVKRKGVWLVVASSGVKVESQ